MVPDAGNHPQGAFRRAGLANSCAYNRTFLNHFPGSCRIESFLYKSKSVAQNFGGIQPAGTRDVIHLSRFRGIEQA
jgi:hypothetical protein